MHTRTLRERGAEQGLEIDVRIATGQAEDPDGGVEHGAVIRRFVEAVLVERADLAAARSACVDALGAKGTKQIAGVIAQFDGINRVADGTGIQLERGMLETGGSEIVDALGLTRARERMPD